MLKLVALVLMAISSAAGQELTFKGVAYGPKQHLICEWFSNFESSRLERCIIAGGQAVRLDDGASIECSSHICQQLDDEARKVARWNKPEPVSGTFTVDLQGRVSATRHKKRYLGDSTMSVSIEHLVSVRPKNTVR